MYKPGRHRSRFRKARRRNDEKEIVDCGGGGIDVSSGRMRGSAYSGRNPNPSDIHQRGAYLCAGNPVSYDCAKENGNGRYLHHKRRWRNYMQMNLNVKVRGGKRTAPTVDVYGTAVNTKTMELDRKSVV